MNRNQFQEVVDQEVNTMMKNDKLKKKIATFWLSFECVAMIVILMYCVTGLWKLPQINMLMKFFFSIMIGIIYYDVFKAFVYSRWILIKEME